MDLSSYRELQVLEQLSENPHHTQRRLSERLGVALGLTNLMVRRLIKKGYLKLTSEPKNRFSYLLTPEGIREKTRLTYEYLEYSLFLYRRIRELLREDLGRAAKSGYKNVVVFGTGDVAEMAYLTLKELELNLIGVIDDRAVGKIFLGLPILSLQELPKLSLDCGIVTSLDIAPKVIQKFHEMGLPEERLVVIEQKKSSVRALRPRSGAAAAHSQHPGMVGFIK